MLCFPLFFDLCWIRVNIKKHSAREFFSKLKRRKTGERNLSGFSLKESPESGRKRQELCKITQIKFRPIIFFHLFMLTFACFRFSRLKQTHLRISLFNKKILNVLFLYFQINENFSPSKIFHTQCLIHSDYYHR